jgi:hypothetical protein
MFLVVNTFTVMLISKGKITNIAIGKPTLVSKLVFLCILLIVFIVFIFKVSNAPRIELRPSL